MNDWILKIENLSLSFGHKKVLDRVSFTLNKGETLGLVGESGSGKSITSLAIMGLLNKNANIDPESKILFKTNNQLIDLTKINSKEYASLRGNSLGMIFQEPMTSLNPSIRCGKQVEESILLHQNLNNTQAKKKVLALFEKVKLPNPERIYKAYPHELSGGQKQRVMIAMAISCEPEVLIADEPTTALDVTVQKATLDLLKELQMTEGMSMLFISHDLGVIANVSEEVLVMYQGKVVEQGRVETIFHQPAENYTKGLIACRPRLDTRYKRLPTVTDFMKNKDFYAEIYSDEERAADHRALYEQAPLLEVKNLKKYFTQSHWFGKEEVQVKAVDDISFKVYPGETLGLVGESGSGKTTLSRTLLLLEKPTSGEIYFRGQDILKMKKEDIRRLRKDIQIIFQDPYSSLNPRHTIQHILTEPMKIHGIGKSNKERVEKAAHLLEKVNLSVEALKKYPHEFSGGQRQRIGIARALALKPQFIICDESVSALDVSVQAQVLNLLNDLKKEFHFTYIFISHDLAVVKYMSDQLLVMQHGQMKELADADQVYSHPKTIYTKELIEAIPKL
ncbi:ABC transporter ATP-binding protein [Weeksella virosa]|uniref:Nickel-transporting ATPase n=1 Tax=Weeksella virosa (strain ATCC 43766 / DSM 16922 / JCM 21250 / CCUG 30538 / CDC 9751 / IAM 14551 / NBRC 16016 / NCTC 11634 / CL345/78) TaxID=865938 RepID=F0P1X2_WEEVC|nr:ABC transporter ATP-binding protein [Weeksella virosa]ADX67682.1 Nickel-transporting ATPase [Weeksella virosa DSM 16922]VEH64693.1 Glutathione import ATP-binding protein GsiA [Weeksella virosa]